MRIVILLLVFIASCTKKEATKLYLICGWDSYDTNKEYFVIDIKKKTVLWVNQKRAVSKVNLTRSTISFLGTRDKVLLSDQTLRDVKLKFTIFRKDLDFQVEMFPYDISIKKISKIGEDDKIYTRGCGGDSGLKIREEIILKKIIQRIK